MRWKEGYLSIDEPGALVRTNSLTLSLSQELFFTIVSRYPTPAHTYIS